MKTYRESIVFVTGSAGAGSGFIATAGTSNYLVTNVHVAAEIADAEFQGLDGAIIHGGAPSMAVGEDLFRMEYPGGGMRFKIMEDVATNVSIGDEVVVLGNAEGAGVVNTLIGKIVGIGPNLVEVDAPFVPGNSGSPIIHLKSGKVIGVATYARFEGFDWGGPGMFGEIKVRRFGYRLDTVKTWEPVEWAKFKAQADEVDEIQKRTYELGEALMTMEGNRGKPVPDGAPDINKALADWRTMNAKKGKWKLKETANEKLAAFLKNACEADVSAAQATVTYDYFKREVTGEKSERDEMEAAIWPAIKAMLM